MTTTAARRTALVVALLGAAGLTWSGSHLLSLRLADPHIHMHEHGLAHGAAADGQQRLAELHAYLGPAALLSALALVAALAALRVLPDAARPPRPALRALPLIATASAGLFVVVEIAEHAVAGQGLPPLALLAVGVLVHACGGLAAAALVRVVPTHGPPLPVRAVPLPPARRPLPTPAWRAPLRAQAMLSVLAGRAPPLTTATPQPS